MTSRQSPQQPWQARAIADLGRLRSADALLAFVLEYESGVPETERTILYQLVAEHGRHIDRRVIDHLAYNAGEFPQIAWNQYLRLEAAEWMAVHLVASVRTPDHLIAAKLFGRRNDALRELIRRFRLTGWSLPAHVLFNEARGKPQTAFARTALERLLLFPELPAHWWKVLRQEWREAHDVARRLDAYHARDPLRDSGAQ